MENASTPSSTSDSTSGDSPESVNWANPVETFEDMGLSPDIVHGIYMNGFESPSPVQQRCIRPIIAGKDVLGQAQSGTGKTATYCLGALQRLSEKPNSVAMILEPTRELANQTASVATALAQNTDCIEVIECSANHTLSENIKTASAASLSKLLVCTPGRAKSLIQRMSRLAQNVILLVLDEADELLNTSRGDRSFEDDIRAVVRNIPQTAQVCMFSATLPEEAVSMSSAIMRDPIKILCKTEQLTLEGIKQFYIDVERDANKPDVIYDLFDTLSISQTVVFVNTKAGVDRLAAALEAQNLPCLSIHGDMEGTEREETMRLFRDGACRVLIATSLIARGVDVQQVSFVLLYDLPHNRETYLHAVGRSGRFGRKGVSVALVTSDDARRLQALQEYYCTQISEMPADVAALL